MKRLALLFIVLASLVALPALATVPSTMSYQGVLTDAGGNLVADGPYNLTFKIYTVPVAGAAIWTEVDPAVSVVKGGFSVVLGNVTSLSSLAFDVKYYLGITVGGGPELSPRVELAASPYGMALRLPFAGSESSSGPVFSIHNGGAGAAIMADPRLDVGSPTSDGTLNWYLNGAPNRVGDLSSDGGNGGKWELYDVAGTLHTSAYTTGPGTGWFYVLGGSIFNGIGMTGSYYAPGDPWIGVFGNASQMSFTTGLSGDGSVNLPADAIDSGEILDEPGIAQAHLNSANVPLGITMTDIVRVTISTPAAGYIVVEADGQHGISANATFSNYAHLQITDVSAGPWDVDHYFDSGFTTPTASSVTERRPVSIRRTYYESAGTYTFYFQGQAVNPGTLTNYIWDPTITATYYPTSYGSVATIVNATEARGFAQAQRVTSGVGTEQVGGGGYVVDLRELELKAAKQRADLAKTQLDLARAKFAAQAKAQSARATGVRKP